MYNVFFHFSINGFGSLSSSPSARPLFFVVCNLESGRVASFPEFTVISPIWRFKTQIFLVKEIKSTEEKDACQAAVPTSAAISSLLTIYLRRH